MQRKAASDVLSAKDMGPVWDTGCPGTWGHAASPASPCVTAPHDPGQLQCSGPSSPPAPPRTAGSTATSSLHSPITIVLCNCCRQGPEMEAFSPVGPSWGWLDPA